MTFPSAATLTRRQALLLAALVWAAIYLPALGSLELKGEEGRRILPAVAMLDTGRWVVPQVGGLPYLSKPPLINWLVGGRFPRVGHPQRMGGPRAVGPGGARAGADGGGVAFGVSLARRGADRRDFCADQHRPHGERPSGRDRGVVPEPVRHRPLPLARRVAGGRRRRMRNRPGAPGRCPGFSSG